MDGFSKEKKKGFVKYSVKVFVTALLKGCKIFRKTRSHHKTGARMVIWSKLHTEDPQILGATVRNLLARATWRRNLCTPYCSVITKAASNSITFTSMYFSVVQQPNWDHSLHSLCCPCRTLASFWINFQASLFLLIFFQPLTPILFEYFSTSSNHLFLGFATHFLFPSGIFLNAFSRVPFSDILSTCPKLLNLSFQLRSGQPLCWGSKLTHN